jgi:hypothetical protein
MAKGTVKSRLFRLRGTVAILIHKPPSFLDESKIYEIKNKT